MTDERAGETPRERDKRLRHLARHTDKLARAELRRVDRLVAAATDEEIMMAAKPALKRARSGNGQTFVSHRRFGVECYRYEVGRNDVARLVHEGKLRFGNKCQSFVVPV